VRYFSSLVASFVSAYFTQTCNWWNLIAFSILRFNRFADEISFGI
jgi:hypothetical protein